MFSDILLLHKNKKYITMAGYFKFLPECLELLDVVSVFFLTVFTILALSES